MFLADLHIHSHYARATSRQLVPEMLALWGRRKGLGVIGTPYHGAAVCVILRNQLHL